jgi:hypothetical protein
VDALARQFARWAAGCGPTSRQGLSRAAFVRFQFDRLHVGAEVATLAFAGRPLLLPPSAQLLAPA